MTTLEIILWIATGIIISEIIFILWTKKTTKNKEDSFIFSSSFFERKFLSLSLTAGFMIIQFAIVYGSGGDGSFSSLAVNSPRYINLLYELLIVSGIALFFYINKKINDKILNKK